MSSSLVVQRGLWFIGAVDGKRGGRGLGLGRGSQEVRDRRRSEGEDVNERGVSVYSNLNTESGEC